MIREIMSLAKYGLTDRGRRSRGLVSQRPSDALHAKLGSSPPAPGDAFGDHKQSVPFLQSQNRRLKRSVGEESERHSARLQNAYIPF